MYLTADAPTMLTGGCKSTRLLWESRELSLSVTSTLTRRFVLCTSRSTYHSSGILSLPLSFVFCQRGARSQLTVLYYCQVAAHAHVSMFGYL